MKAIDLLKEKIAPSRQLLIDHPVYASLNHMDDLRLFMEHHVYAVWDFMSLLKSLQQHLTCTTTPWVPVGSPNTRFLINEIVVGEESDVDQHGVRMSHFEMYLKAMREAGCKMEGIEAMMNSLRAGSDLASCLNKIPYESAYNFSKQTFSFIETGKPHLLAAVFTFGREDLIPDMFLSLIKEIGKDHPEATETIRYYIERHIEVDGGHHSHLAYEMTEELCGNDADKWKEATEACIVALESRKLLWDSIYETIQQRELII